MCFHSQQSQDAQTLQKRFGAKFLKPQLYTPGIYNGFSFPATPIITHSNPESIQLFYWGLIPSWSKDIDFRKNTLNAKIETITEKPSFRQIVHQRCLILVDAFFEWQWLDSQGKKKQKYCIASPDDSAFALAGLWNAWVNPQTGEIIDTYTILTAEANEQMSQIHNSKKRMPFVLLPEEESLWLANKDLPWQRNICLKTTPI